MVLWYRQGDVAYYHLAAYSDEGYRQRARSRRLAGVRATGGRRRRNGPVWAQGREWCDAVKEPTASSDSRGDGRLEPERPICAGGSSAPRPIARSRASGASTRAGTSRPIDRASWHDERAAHENRDDHAVPARPVRPGAFKGFPPPGADDEAHGPRTGARSPRVGSAPTEPIVDPPTDRRSGDLRRHAGLRREPATSAARTSATASACWQRVQRHARPPLADQRRPVRAGVRAAHRRAWSASSTASPCATPRSRWRSRSAPLGLTGEVIVPSFTFVATAHALQWQEITPVFCDIDPRRTTSIPTKVERDDHAAHDRHHRRPPLGPPLRRRRRWRRSRDGAACDSSSTRRTRSAARTTGA